jgi:uncharacterized protein with NRDE domain
LLDTPWPKLVRTKQKLQQALVAPLSVPRLFELLADRSQAPADELPEWGLPPSFEAKLSAPFVLGESYGTRSSTILLWGRDGHVRMHERRYNSQGEHVGETELELQT